MRRFAACSRVLWQSVERLHVNVVWEPPAAWNLPLATSASEPSGKWRARSGRSSRAPPLRARDCRPAPGRGAATAAPSPGFRLAAPADGDRRGSVYRFDRRSAVWSAWFWRWSGCCTAGYTLGRTEVRTGWCSSWSEHQERRAADHEPVSTSTGADGKFRLDLPENLGKFGLLYVREIGYNSAVLSRPRPADRDTVLRLTKPIWIRRRLANASGVAVSGATLTWRMPFDDRLTVGHGSCGLEWLVAVLVPGRSDRYQAGRLGRPRSRVLTAPWPTPLCRR